jgi:hypothetical protein
MIWKDASNNRINVKFVDTESSDKPLNGFSGWFEQEVWRKMDKESFDTGVELVILLFRLKARKNYENEILTRSID